MPRGCGGQVIGSVETRMQARHELIEGVADARRKGGINHRLLAKRRMDRRRCCGLVPCSVSWLSFKGRAMSRASPANWARPITSYQLHASQDSQLPPVR